MGDGEHPQSVSKPVSLGYARSAAFRRRGTVIWIVLVVLLAGIVTPVKRWLAPLQDQAARLYWQRRCMAFTAPPEQVMYEEDAQAAAALLAGSADYQPTAIGELQKLSGLRPVEFVSNVSQQLRWCGTTSAVFLHERYSPGGNRRLVLVNTHEGWPEGNGQRKVPICFAIGTPATWKPGSTVSMASSVGPSLILSTSDRLRLYAGQPDPADPSHFTIRYAINGAPGLIDGWLQDNDGIRFRLRDGPATTRPSQYFVR